ncbi:MAG: lysophospholipase [Spirochaetaceae bacterium]|jgi:alpha-beta hydrolase superfamily lysophospholipase|nr:lysophospholipase [Spirochaetaceae bacterium]
MAIHELDFRSFNEKDTIKAWIYTPIRKPRAIVQVVHGLGEHSRRYLSLILRLNEEGFVVSADDHVGHGKTAADSDTWGDFGRKGYRTTREDEKTLHDLVTQAYPGLPFILFGHSWGSMIVRDYAAYYGAHLSGLIICGTSGQRLMEALAPLKKEIKGLIDAGRGDESDPQYVAKVFAGMTDRYENPQTPNDWISGDPDVVRDHGTDPFNNSYRPSTLASLYALADLVESIIGPPWAERLPRELPIYNIAGDQDPVGDYGEGVYAVSNWLANTGHRRVKTQLYSGHRHEIHNDRDIRKEVEDGIVAFINSVL